MPARRHQFGGPLNELDYARAIDPPFSFWYRPGVFHQGHSPNIWIGCFWQHSYSNGLRLLQAPTPSQGQVPLR